MIYKLIKSIYSIADSSSKRKLFKLQILIVLSSILELISLSALGLFINFIASPENQKLTLFNEYLNSIGLEVSLSILDVGIVSILLLFFGTLMSIFTIWRVSLFATFFGVSIGNKLFSNYLNQSYLYHVKTNSSILAKKISVEALRFTEKIVLQLMLMNARLVIVIGLLIALIIFDPYTSLSVFSIFILSYYLLFSAVAKSLLNNGKSFSRALSKRFKSINEGLNFFPSVVTLNKKSFFIKEVEEFGAEMAISQGTNSALSVTPKYFMEFIIFGGFVFFVISNAFLGQLSSELMTKMSIFGIAAIKFLPAFQQIYNALTQVKGNVAAWDEIKSDLLLDSKYYKQEVEDQIKVGNGFYVENLCFGYSNKNLILKNISFVIKQGQKIGIIGSSGSGKSTLLNVLVGLLEPNSGTIRTQFFSLNNANKKEWFNSIGYVPQANYISDRSILENIAFGVSKKDINLSQINKVLELSNLENFINSLQDGIDTKIGEHGVKISGGQKQRLMIARALYHNPKIIFFDEATSALDGKNETRIMESINRLNDSIVIMVTHRLNTIKDCDQVILLEDGKITDIASFQTLHKTHKVVREMNLE